MEHIDWHPRLWIDGTRDLSAEERGVYFDLINLMYDLGGPITEDRRWLAGHCGISTRRFSTILTRLMALGKVRRIEGFDEVSRPKLTANRVEAELKRARDAIEQRRNARAARGKSKSDQRPTHDGRTSRVPNEPLTAVPPTRTITIQESPLPPGMKDGEEAETVQTDTDQPISSEPIAALIADMTERMERPTAPVVPAQPGRCTATNPRAIGTNPRARHVPLPPSDPPAGSPDALRPRWEAIREEVGEGCFRTWISPLQVAGIDGAQATILAPSKFHAAWIDQHHRDTIARHLGITVQVTADRSPITPADVGAS